MPTRIPIYKYDLDEFKKEILTKLDLIKSDLELLLKDSNKKKPKKVGD